MQTSSSQNIDSLTTSMSIMVLWGDLWSDVFASSWIRIREDKIKSIEYKEFSTIMNIGLGLTTT